jgi:pimeloyl-ACP methyl ester carboxylesterase
VLVLPGFLGNDEYLRPLRGWLSRIGYGPQTSGVAINIGTPSALLGAVLRRAEHVATPGGRRMIVVGHSLGGIFARALALMRPDLVAHAICLGTPLRGDPRAASHPFVAGLGRLLLSEHGGRPANEALEAALLGVALPESVRLTSLYSRTDAVVDWRSCIDLDPRAAAVEVHGTHCGLAWNVEVYRALGPLLASSPP